MQLEPGREPDVDAPTGSRAVTWATVDLTRGSPSARAAHSSRVAVRRLVAASSAGEPSALVDVGVARPGARCRTRAAATCRSISSWSGAVRGAAGAPVEGVHQVDVAGACRRGPSRTTGIADRSTVPVRYICGCSVEPGLAVAPDRLAGPTEAESIAAQAAAAVVQRRGQQRLADALALAARAARRTSPGTTSARGGSDVAMPDHARSSSSATQQPPGSVRSEVPGALDPRPARCAGGAALRARARPAATRAQVELEEALVAQPLGGRDVLGPSSAGSDVTARGHGVSRGRGG